MITLEDWMKSIGYKITDGSRYYAFGSDTFLLEYWDGIQEGVASSIAFDTTSGMVYQAEVHDFANKRSYRIVNSDLSKDQLGDLAKEAYDDVDFIDLSTEEDFLTKLQKIVAGQPYDTRVSVDVELDDAELFQLMKIAHNQDITFNKLVENIIENAIGKSLSDKD